MLIASSSDQHTNSFGADLLQQLVPNNPALRFAGAIPWRGIDRAFAKHYRQGLEIPAKPIRLLMTGLLIMKQLENFSGEAVVLQFKRNPFYQAFCSFNELSCQLPCDSRERAPFRKGVRPDPV